jgi:hypothetical protein
MGHTEMLLAVAGFDQNAIAERIRRLAEGEWSSFTPAERAAFAFAHKQAKEPAAISGQDVDSLVKHFGVERALDVIWWSCRCHYMTCVSDAFQLQLERDNVFDGFLPASGNR